MALDHAAIARCIPHAGRMCLLHAVQGWDEGQIQASAISHRAPDHPLRSGGGLGVAAGIEYAAQAMAVHGSLLGGSVPRAGRLASVRGVQCHVRWLDRESDELSITARRISGDDAGMVYDFEIRAAGKLLLNGRASVALLPAGAGAA
ncbi:MAG: 3-hydroxylacyl-ACP dehydratase [Hylemonella sp.]|nr:3-hydroxylacyl-ACP dehydratase [Hylemonella sp.]